MGYQMIAKQYKGSVPVRTEYWKLDKIGKEEQRKAHNMPCMLRYIRERKEREERFVLRLEML